MQPNSRSTNNQANRSRPAQQSRTGSSQSGGTRTSTSTTSSANPSHTIVCRKCKSPQIVANKKGYSFANFFKTLGWMILGPVVIFIIMYLLMVLALFGFGGMQGLAIITGICWVSVSLSLPVAILVGFAGRSEIVNGCMNCGFKWIPAKRK